MMIVLLNKCVNKILLNIYNIYFWLSFCIQFIMIILISIIFIEYLILFNLLILILTI